MDTSIPCCLLRVHNLYMEVEEEILSIINRSKTLILPIASIIESGNYLAYISDEEHAKGSIE